MVMQMDNKQIKNKLTNLNLQLACPVCHQILTVHDRGMGCPDGHFFNFSKSGTINFISTKVHPQTDDACRNEMALHGLSPYQDLLGSLMGETNGTGPVILTGSSLSPFLKVDCMGFEISIRSVDLQLRRDPALALFAAKADALPLPDGSVTSLIRLDSQPGLTESLRVVKPGGSIWRIIPGPTHHLEVRQFLFSGRRLGLREKPALIREMFQLRAQGIQVESTRFRIKYQPSPEAWPLLIAHWSPEQMDRLPLIRQRVDEVTFAFDRYRIRKPL